MNRKTDARIKQTEPLWIALSFMGLTLAITDSTLAQFFGVGNFALEIILFLVSTPLIFQRYFPKNYSKIINAYSYIAITYSMPFFLTFMYLNNPSYKIWNLLLVAASAILAQCVTFKKLWLIIFIGCSAAILMSELEPYHRNLPNDALMLLAFCLGIILYFSHFSNKVTQEYEKKINLIENVVMTIAHELRTPIASIKAGSLGIENILPLLVDAYEKAKSAHLVTAIDPNHLNALKKAIKNISYTCLQANMSIDIFLKNISEPQKTATSLCSAKDIIMTSLNEYPFTENDKKKIHHDLVRDFKFIGDGNLMKYVFFNLLKNALFHSRCSLSHSISIQLSQNDHFGKIIVKDTGTGIDPQNLPYIFDKLFSCNNQKGTGLGLYYCKNCIEQFGGKIECKSEQNQYSEFSIYLPQA